MEQAQQNAINAHIEGSLLAIREAVHALITTHPDRNAVVTAMAAFGDIASQSLLDSYAEAPEQARLLLKLQGGYQDTRDQILAQLQSDQEPPMNGR